MKHLTKDDFGEADSVWIIIKKPLSQFKEVRDQILKNQEVVERLKKYYDGAKRNDYNIDKELCRIFQRILGEEEAKVTTKWDETYYGGAKNE